MKKIFVLFGRFVFKKIISVQKNNSCSENDSWLNDDSGLGLSEVFYYDSYLVGYEVFGVATIVGLA